MCRHLSRTGSPRRLVDGLTSAPFYYLPRHSKPDFSRRKIHEIPTFLPLPLRPSLLPARSSPSPSIRQRRGGKFAGSKRSVNLRTSFRCASMPRFSHSKTRRNRDSFRPCVAPGYLKNDTRLMSGIFYSRTKTQLPFQPHLDNKRAASRYFCRPDTKSRTRRILCGSHARLRNLAIGIR